MKNLSSRILLGAIFLVAFALRVYRLDAQALWWDESLSVYRATRDLGAILSNVILIQNIVTVDTLPQLYFVLLHFLVPAFGISEFALRFFSVFVNVATLPLVYILAHRWLNQSVALVATFLAALSPFYVWYAQEARPYALVLFFSILASYALTRAFTSLRFTFYASRLTARASHFNTWLVIYILASIAALFTHYYAIFLFPFHLVLIALLIWRTTNWRARMWIFLPALPLATMIVLLPQVRASAAGNANSGPSFVPLDIILRDVLNSFSVGVTLEWNAAMWFDAAMLVLLLIGIFFPNSKIKIQNSQMGIANLEFRILNLTYLFIPIAGIFILSFIRPLYQNSRYLITISPAFYLGVAAGVSALMRRWKFSLVPACGVCVLGAVLSLNNLYFNPTFAKDDHRAWAAALRERTQPGDFLILDSPHTEELYRYYADNLVPMTTLPVLRADGKPSPDADLAAVREAYRNHARVWFLAMNVPFDDPDKRIEKLLKQEGVLIDEMPVAGTSTEISLSLFLPALPMVAPGEIVHPLNIVFAGNLRLRGFDLPETLTAGKTSVAKLFWQIDEPVGEDYAVSLRLVDDTHHIIEQWDETPLGNRAGTSTWDAGKIIAETRAISIAPETRPGNYRWQVVPYHALTGNPLGEPIVLGIAILQ